MIMQIFVNFWSILTIIDHKVFVTLHSPLYVIEGFLKAIPSTINSLIESETLFKISHFGPGFYSNSSQDSIRGLEMIIICSDMLSVVLFIFWNGTLTYEFHETELQKTSHL